MSLKIIAAVVLGLLLSISLVYLITDMLSPFMNFYNFGTFTTIFAIGTSQMKTLRDEWTLVTDDNSCSIQVENTILITQNGNEVLTKV